MKNSELPAMPLVNDNGHPLHASHVAWDNKPLVSGLTKREHFAGLAMQGFISAGSNGMPNAGELSNMAKKYADALLYELDKPIE